MNNTRVAGLLLILAACLAAYAFYAERQTPPELANQGAPSSTLGAAIVQIALPAQLSSEAQMGQRAYEAACAACHGQNGAGQDGVAPPLVHIIYEPNHHGDESFQRAVALGVQSHHWDFGNMAPVPGLTRADVATIVTYIRELQRENGIN